MREKIQQLQLKIAEGKLQDDLIASLKNAGLNKDSYIKGLEKLKNNIILSKDNHIKDQQTTITEMQNSNNVLKKTLESINNEIVQLKTFISSKQ